MLACTAADTLRNLDKKTNCCVCPLSSESQAGARSLPCRSKCKPYCLNTQGLSLQSPFSVWCLPTDHWLASFPILFSMSPEFPEHGLDTNKFVIFSAAHLVLYVYPFLNTTDTSRPFEYLRLTSLGVVGALVKVGTKHRSPRASMPHPPLLFLNSILARHLTEGNAKFAIKQMLASTWMSIMSLPCVDFAMRYIYFGFKDTVSGFKRY